MLGWSLLHVALAFKAKYTVDYLRKYQKHMCVVARSYDLSDNE